MELLHFDVGQPRFIPRFGGAERTDRKQQHSQVRGASLPRQPTEPTKQHERSTHTKLHSDHLPEEPEEVELVHTLEKGGRQAEERRRLWQREGHPFETGLLVQEEQQTAEQGVEEEVRDAVRRRTADLPSQLARLHGRRAREGDLLAVRHCEGAGAETERFQVYHYGGRYQLSECNQRGAGRTISYW